MANFIINPIVIPEDEKANLSVRIWKGTPRSSNTSRLDLEVVNKHGDEFYDYPVKGKEPKKYVEQLNIPQTFSTWRGGKKCGGFHSDFGLEISTKKRNLFVQVCFGCHEVKVFDDKNEVRYDISRNDFMAFIQSLDDKFKNIKVRA